MKNGVTVSGWVTRLVVARVKPCDTSMLVVSCGWWKMPKPLRMEVLSLTR